MFPQMGKKRARTPIISMTPCGHVSYIEMSLVTSTMYHVRKHMLRPSADSRAESELRNGENDSSTSCIMKRASTWARRSLGTLVMQTPSVPGLRHWKTYSLGM